MGSKGVYYHINTYLHMIVMIRLLTYHPGVFDTVIVYTSPSFCTYWVHKI